MFGTGRIGEIKRSLEATHGCPIKKIPAAVKLDAVCMALQISGADFDDLIASNSPVLRTVKGHCFESYFDELMEFNGVKVIEVGGDDSVDRIVNGHKLQLKTPTAAGTNSSSVQYKTHKTHGAKSEQESMDYYHSVNEFADFLVGLVSYSPLQILVVEKGKLTKHPASPNHILSPLSINRQNNPDINAFQKLGIGSALKVPPASAGSGLLPKCTAAIGVSDDVILNTIISDANFRIWDMSIRGFARERVFTYSLLGAGVPIAPPAQLRTLRADKADHGVVTPNGPRFLQMKGISTNNCDFSLSDPLIATETQLTRGRVNDHPTQSRLYLRSDFDYLVLALDPPIASLCLSASGGQPTLSWEFYMIPTGSLRSHGRLNHRLASLQSFTYSGLQSFKVSSFANIKFK